MTGSNFLIRAVQILNNKYQKINFKCEGLNIDFPDWIKKATINPKNGDHKCFQYITTVA